MPNKQTSFVRSTNGLWCGLLLGTLGAGCAIEAPHEDSAASSSYVTANPGSTNDITLVRSFSAGRGHWASVRDVPDGFTPEQTFLLHLTGTHALFACQVREHNMVSSDPNCEGQPQLGFLGYADNNAEGTKPGLYRCNAGGDHFITSDPNCEGYTVEGLIGFAENTTPPPPLLRRLRRPRRSRTPRRSRSSAASSPGWAIGCRSAARRTGTHRR